MVEKTSGEELEDAIGEGGSMLDEGRVGKAQGCGWRWTWNGSEPSQTKTRLNTG